MFVRIAMIAVGLGVASHSGAEGCRLSGVWKSDAARTLAAIAVTSDPKALNTLSDGFFGHMIHEWTCTEMRAWLDDDERGRPVGYKIVESEGNSVVVSFPDGSEQNLRLTFEGECYKIFFDEQRFEYFCPIESQQ